MNYFSFAEAAKRYAQSRPNFHPLTIARIKNSLHLTGNVPQALDVACGTGLSTRALTAIADQVVGTDSAEEMLRWCVETPHLQYVKADAEAIPFPAHHFDLITVCSGVHWFSIDVFLKEVARVMTSQGHLILYDNFFLSRLVHQPDFASWYATVYLPKFPAPPRQSAYPWTNEHLIPQGFELIQEETFENVVAFTKAELIGYLTTQSNITAAIETGQETYHSVEEWLAEKLEPFFEEATTKHEFVFGNWIKYLRQHNTL